MQSILLSVCLGLESGQSVRCQWGCSTSGNDWLSPQPPGSIAVVLGVDPVHCSVSFFKKGFEDLRKFPFVYLTLISLGIE